MSNAARVGARTTTSRRGYAAALMGALLGLGCGPADESESFASVFSRLSVCDEAVPSEHYVDGIPAYQQCAESENSPIYSSNGVDTSTSEQDGWYRTQYSGGYQCTEYATRYFHFVWGITWVPRGNAGEWCDSSPPADSGLELTDLPVHGDAIVFAPGDCGASATYGHVAVVDLVDDANARVTIVEQNRANRRATDQSCATCFLHVVENDGAIPAGTGGADGAGGQVNTGGREPAGGEPGTGGSVVTGGVMPIGGQETTGGFAATAGTAPTGGQRATGGVVGTGGQPTTGGFSGTTGGSPVMGGSDAAGGSPIGTGGSTGGFSPNAATGGTGASAAGAPPTGGDQNSEPAVEQLVDEQEDAGCACRTPTQHGGGSVPRFAFAVLMLATLLSRRKTRVANS